MSDSKIVGLDGRTPASMRAIYTKVEEQAQLQAKKMATEGRVAEIVTAGIIAGLQNITEHFAAENAKLFEQLEEIAVDRVLAEIERRSLRGRIRMLWMVFSARLRELGMELGLVNPLVKPSNVKLEP